MGNVQVICIYLFCLFIVLIDENFGIVVQQWIVEGSNMIVCGIGKVILYSVIESYFVLVVEVVQVYIVECQISFGLYVISMGKKQGIGIGSWECWVVGINDISVGCKVVVVIGEYRFYNYFLVISE